MWQVFYQDGSTLREDAGQDWADISKEGIRVVQLSWEPFDWEAYLRSEFEIFHVLFPQWTQIEALLDPPFQEYDTIKTALSETIGKTTGKFQKSATDIHNSIEQKYLEADARFRDTKDPKEKAEARKEAVYLSGFLVRARNLRSSIGSYQHQLRKSVSLKAWDSPVAFFQHKHHITGMTKSFGTVLDERIAQEVGMVYNKEGDYTSALMDLKTGDFIMKLGNVHEVGLNLELHGINLEVLP